MENITSEVASTERWLPQPLISNRITDIVTYTFVVGAGVCISLLGMAGNLLNIIIFLHKRIEDSIGLKFLFRSISDFAYSSLVVVGSLFMLVHKVSPGVTALDSLSFAYSLGMASEKIYFTSVVVTVCISVERCACIIFPLQIKSVFTKTRSLATVVVISIVGLAFLIPDYLTAGLSWSYDPNFRSMRIKMWQAYYRSQFEIPKETIIGAVVPVLAGVATTVSTVLMISAIKSSNKFRRSQSTDYREFSKTTWEKPRKTTLSPSDVKQTKIVITVNFVLIICSIPDYVIVATAIVRSYIPEFSLLAPAGIYRNVVVVINDVAYTFEAFNCAVTFLVHFVSSCNFRQTFRRIVNSAVFND